MRLGLGLGVTALRFGGGSAQNALRFAATSQRHAQKLGNAPEVSTVPVRSLSASGTTATAVIDSTAWMNVGGLASISSATPSAYNGNFPILSIDIDGRTFTYGPLGSSDPAVGSGGTCALITPMGAGRRFDVSSITSSGTTATIAVTTTLDGITTGDQLFIYGSNAQGYNGLVTVASTPTSTTATYTMSQTAGGVASSGHYVVEVKRKTIATEIVLTLGSGSWSELRLLLPNWCIGFTGSNDTILGGPGGCTINDASITIGSAYAPVLFGGSASTSITSSTAEVLSDAVVPGNFVGGTPTFTQGTTVIIKAKVTRTGFNGSVPVFGVNPSQVGGKVHNYTTGDVTVSSTYSASSYTVTGRSQGAGYLFDVNLQGPAFSIVGRPVSATTKSLFAIGDSITEGVGDSVNINNVGATVTNAAQGRTGWFDRSMWDTSFTAATARASMNVAVSGSTAVLYTKASPIGTSLTWFTNWMDYATHLVEATGANGYTGVFDTAMRSLWATAKGKGLNVTKVTMDPRTTSTDSWTLAANQTPFAGYGVAGAVSTAEASWAALVGTLIDQYTILYSQRVGATNDRTQANYWKWITDESTALYGCDNQGLHPSPKSHTLKANDFRTAAAALP